MVRTRATIFSSSSRAFSRSRRSISSGVHPDSSEQSGAPHYSDSESFRNLSAVLTQACQRELKFSVVPSFLRVARVLGGGACSNPARRLSLYLRNASASAFPEIFSTAAAAVKSRRKEGACSSHALTCIVTTFALPQSRTPLLSAHWAIKRGRYRSYAMDVKIFRHWIIALCVLGFFAVPASIAKSPTNEADCKNAGKIWLNERQKCVPIRISERPRSTARTVLGLVGLGCALGGLILLWREATKTS